MSTVNNPQRLIDLTPELPCCYGHAMNGPAGCTCWRAVYNVDAEPMRAGPMGRRQQMCADCAYRPDSPERQATTGAACSAEEPGGLPVVPGVFVCHQGMKVQIGVRHESTGVFVAEPPGVVASYDGRTWAGRAWKANGEPADLCAGQDLYSNVLRGDL